ncbi:hypothetical protein PM082_010184 [Marasmius tenuissimus]|nr:hypothetical protein PM082_010184 [Marasmius tenuissimus]
MKRPVGLNNANPCFTLLPFEKVGLVVSQRCGHSDETNRIDEQTTDRRTTCCMQRGRDPGCDYGHRRRRANQSRAKHLIFFCHHLGQSSLFQAYTPLSITSFHSPLR